jgi:hypothetical protein
LGRLVAEFIETLTSASDPEKKFRAGVVNAFSETVVREDLFARKLSGEEARESIETDTIEFAIEKNPIPIVVQRGNETSSST